MMLVARLACRACQPRCAECPEPLLLKRTKRYRERLSVQLAASGTQRRCWCELSSPMELRIRLTINISACTPLSCTTTPSSTGQLPLSTLLKCDHEARVQILRY